MSFNVPILMSSIVPVKLFHDLIMLYMSVLCLSYKTVPFYMVDGHFWGVIDWDSQLEEGGVFNGPQIKGPTFATPSFASPGGPQEGLLILSIGPQKRQGHSGPRLGLSSELIMVNPS